jgi:hypothetical protein
MKHWKKNLVGVGIGVTVLMTPSNTFAQPSQTQPSEFQRPGVSVDLTSVVVAALTLGFGYGVLRTFQGGSK